MKNAFFFIIGTVVSKRSEITSHIRRPAQDASYRDVAVSAAASTAFAYTSENMTTEYTTSPQSSSSGTGSYQVKT